MSQGYELNFDSFFCDMEDFVQALDTSGWTQTITIIGHSGQFDKQAMILFIRAMKDFVRSLVRMSRGTAITLNTPHEVIDQQVMIRLLNLINQGIIRLGVNVQGIMDRNDS